MKILRHGPVGEERPGIVDPEGIARDISNFSRDFDQQFFDEGGIENLESLTPTNIQSFPAIDENTRLGSPLKNPSKIICVGLNYAKHAAESGMPVPEEPVLFFKATSAICGPFDPVIIPRKSKKTDWEVELGVVIGRKASYVTLEEAMEYVAGYVLHNDYSEREFQLERSGQWVKGKSCDTFAPLGPWIVTKSEIPDPHNLRLWLKVNDELLQNSSTSDFVFGIPYLVHYISQFMTLLPGDIISTGTPSGVGLGFDPPRFLSPGDVVELGIDGLGVSRQVAKAAQ
jgi:2-keto-4-pentenoate hydratase/2-oxohepta-3-ene-1,7-dioic acid hydratase in catechol pathway